jgi:hypothetical protein
MSESEGRRGARAAESMVLLAELAAAGDWEKIGAYEAGVHHAPGYADIVRRYRDRLLAGHDAEKAAATTRALKIMVTTVNAVIETVTESDQTMGAPGGVLYAALMTQGMSLEYFEAMMSAIVNSGKLVKRGDCYFAPQEAGQ